MIKIYREITTMPDENFATCRISFKLQVLSKDKFDLKEFTE